MRSSPAPEAADRIRARPSHEGQALILVRAIGQVYYNKCIVSPYFVDSPQPLPYSGWCRGPPDPRAERVMESTKAQVVALLRSWNGGTAHQLASALGMSPAAVRRHLDGLRAEGW